MVLFVSLILLVFFLNNKYAPKLYDKLTVLYVLWKFITHSDFLWQFINITFLPCVGTNPTHEVKVGNNVSMPMEKLFFM